jgi:hypothetical protein
VAGFIKGKSAICGYVGSPTLLTTYRVAKLGMGPDADPCGAASAATDSVYASPGSAYSFD